MSKETIEEAAERLVNRPYGNVVSKSSFIEGAAWQAERMYSKEEVDRLLDTLIEQNMCSVVGDELIKQFKKQKP